MTMGAEQNDPGAGFEMARGGTRGPCEVGAAADQVIAPRKNSTANDAPGAPATGTRTDIGRAQRPKRRPKAFSRLKNRWVAARQFQ
jgi:hypothetical protein